MVFHRNTSVMSSMKHIGVQISRTAGRCIPHKELISLAELLCGRTADRSLVSLAEVLCSITASRIYPPRVGQFGRTAYKAYFCKIYGHVLKHFLLFPYKLKFSEAYVSLNIDLGPIEFYHFCTLQIKLSNFGRLPPPGLVNLAELQADLLIFLTELLCGQTASRSNPPSVG